MRRVLQFLILSSSVLGTGKGYAQVKQREQVAQVWAGYFNQTRLNDKWGFWLEGQLRTKEDVVKDLSQSIARVGLTYYLSDAAKLTAGYAFVNHFPQAGHAEISRPEHRIWQQFQWHTKYRRLRTMQWFRLEERYRRNVLNNETLGEGYAFNYRARYNLLVQLPLATEVRKGTVSLLLNNEVHVNFGKEIVNNYFDQNRAFVGAAYNLTNSDNIQAGYLNVFQQLPAGNRYRTTHALRLSFFHNLDLRRKRE